jgi:hypothetical protein
MLGRISFLSLFRLVEPSAASYASERMFHMEETCACCCCCLAFNAFESLTERKKNMVLRLLRNSVSYKIVYFRPSAKALLSCLLRSFPNVVLPNDLRERLFYSHMGLGSGATNSSGVGAKNLTELIWEFNFLCHDACWLVSIILSQLAKQNKYTMWLLDTSWHFKIKSMIKSVLSLLRWYKRIF